MSKGNGQTAQSQEYNFPQKKEKTTFLQFFYNKKDGTYCGRTPDMWAKLGLFYLIFYIVLAALFAICMQGLFSTLKDNQPRWQGEESLIGTSPGLGFRPLSDETERGAVIQFARTKPLERTYWTGLLDSFLKTYSWGGAHCDFGQKPEHEACKVDLNSFGPCAPSSDYGYTNDSVCVFLKLNKIYGWEPQYYDNPTDFPDDMPQDLRDYITALPAAERKQIWVSCGGQHSVDKELVTAINYYPARGFPEYYYPYLNQNNYSSPLVAVKFTNFSTGRMVNIECRSWAKNIIYSGSSLDRKGSVTFQLFVD